VNIMCTREKRRTIGSSKKHRSNDIPRRSPGGKITLFAKGQITCPPPKKQGFFVGFFFEVLVFFLGRLLRGFAVLKVGHHCQTSTEKDLFTEKKLQKNTALVFDV